MPPGRRWSRRRGAARTPSNSPCACAPKLTATLAQPALAASCRSWVVSPIIRVRSGAQPSSRISSFSMRGSGLPAVSSAQRVASNKVAERRAAQGVVEADPGLAGGHAEPVVARLQRLQHRQRAVEQDDLVEARPVVVAIALAELAVPLLRQLRGGMAQRVGQAEADDVARVAVARDRRADVGACRLDAARDQPGRVEQRPVPVEDDQVEAARRHRVFFHAGGAQRRPAGLETLDQSSSGVIFVPSRLRLAIRPPLVST